MLVKSGICFSNLQHILDRGHQQCLKWRCQISAGSYSPVVNPECETVRREVAP